LPVYVPSLLYRFSLKSTAIVYAPFVWIIHSHRDQGLAVGERLDDVTTGATERLTRYFAYAVLAVTAVCLLITGSQLAIYIFDENVQNPVALILRDVLIPTNGFHFVIKGWHVARVVNSLAVVWLFLYADRARRRIESGRLEAGSVLRTLDAIPYAQLFLALYTTYCVLSRFALFAFWEKLPPVEWQWLP